MAQMVSGDSGASYWNTTWQSARF